MNNPDNIPPEFFECGLYKQVVLSYRWYLDLQSMRDYISPLFGESGKHILLFGSG